jgi:hypothetical protein
MHSVGARATGTYSHYCIWFDSVWRKQARGARWDTDIAVVASWRYNEEAGEGAGHLLGAESPFGAQAGVVAETVTPYTVPPSIGRDASAEPAIMTHRVRAELHYWAPRDKWFVHGAKGRLKLTAGMVVTAPLGATLTRTDIEFALPGGVFKHSSPCIKAK